MSGFLVRIIRCRLSCGTIDSLCGCGLGLFASGCRNDVLITLPALPHDLLPLLLPLLLPFLILLCALTLRFFLLWCGCTRGSPAGNMTLWQDTGFYCLLTSTAKSRNVLLRCISGANFTLFAQAGKMWECA